MERAAVLITALTTADQVVLLVSLEIPACCAIVKQEMLPQTPEPGQQVGYVPPHPPLPMSYVSMVGCAIIRAKIKDFCINVLLSSPTNYISFASFVK